MQPTPRRFCNDFETIIDANDANDANLSDANDAVQSCTCSRLKMNSASMQTGVELQSSASSSATATARTSTPTFVQSHFNVIGDVIERRKFRVIDVHRHRRRALRRQNKNKIK